MGNSPGLQGPDGRPARQFGEEIVEPGDPFTGDTMDVIRSLVDEREPRHVDESPKRVQPDTSPEEPEQSIIVQRPQYHQNDWLVGDFAEFSKLANSYAKAMTLDPEGVDVHSADTSELAVQELVQAEVIEVPERQPGKDHVVVDSAVDEGAAKCELTENIAQVLSDLDDFAGVKLAEVEARDVQDPEVPNPRGWNAVDVPPAPPLKVKKKWLTRSPRRAKPEWRKLNVVEGAPGRAVRKYFSKPRNVAILMLIFISLWKPWFIPILTLMIFLIVLFAVTALGPDRVAAIVGWWYARLKRRNPQKAKRLIRRGNRMLRKAEGLANRLPPAWVAGFHLPELDDQDRAADNDAHLQARLERIAAQEQVGTA